MSSFFALSLAVLLLATFSQGQILYGTLTGNVTDNSGAAVTNAKVEALNVATGVTQQSTTNSSGIYRFTVQPGTYKVTVTASGFNASVADNVVVQVNNIRRVDAQLAVAGAQQQVEVTAEAPILQTDKADVHTDITEKQIENLPITSSEGRNFQALYKIVPGAGLPMEANSAGGNPQRAISANVNGQSIQGNNTRIDGVQDAYPWLPQNIAYVPPADSIETVNVTTDAYDPEQGMAGGAAMNVQIKSGTNQLHGEAYEFHTDNALHAKDFFTPQTTKNGAGQLVPFRNPKNILNQFGGNIGGPIVKDKLFFFGDYERTTQRQLATQFDSVPTAAERAGDFSAITTPLYDPNTGSANGTGRSQLSCNGVANMICANRIDPATAKLLSLVPLPNVPNATNDVNNYFAANDSPFTRNDVDAKINWVPTQKATVFGRYSISWSHIFDPPALGAAGGNATNNGQTGNADSRIQNVGLGGTYTFSPTLLGDWNLGFTRQRLNAEATDIGTNFGLDVLGIPGTNNAGIPGNTTLYGGQPAFQFSTYSNLGNPNTGNPFLFRDNQWVTNENLSWIKGKHSLRFGIEFNRVGLNHFQPQGGAFQTARGSFQFGNAFDTALNGGAAPNQYNSLAAFLLGLPSEVGKATQIVNPIAIRWSQWAWYARDAFQLTPKLTLTYGLRWEYYPVPTSDNGRGIRFLDVNSMNVIIGGVNGIPQDDGIDVGHGQFLPRVGVAYRMTENTVIRAGYGMSADPNNFRFVRNWYPSVDNSDFTGVLGQQYAPAASLTGLNAALAPYGTIPIGIPAPSLPDISTGVIPLPDGRTTGTMANPYHRGYINSYNLTVERDFAGFVGQVGYVGSVEINPLTNMNINPAAIAGGQNGRLLNSQFGHTSANTCATPTNPTATCRGWGDINSEMPFKSNNYNSLQATLTRHFRGSQFGVAYTYSKALNYSDNEELNFLLFPYPAYWQKNYGLASFDRTHNFQFYGIFNLPFGADQPFLKSGIGSKLAGGWQLNWIFSHYSGTPFTITANNGAFNAPGNTETADVVGPVQINGCESSAKAGSCTYFSPSSFAAPTGPRFGTGGRDIVRGPGFTNLDASLFRNFKLSERFTFQFRAEAFGLTNTPHFANPTNNGTFANVSLANFGVITSTLGGNSGTNLDGARTFWFAGKVIF